MNRFRISVRLASFLLTAFFAPTISSFRASAADTVAVYVSKNASLDHTGEIVDYTGESLILKQRGGPVTIPAEKVRGIETTRLPEHVQGDALFTEGKFTEALVQYRLAGKEPRRWVQRELLARMAQAYLETGNIEKAGASFLVLLKSDPKTLHFAAIPLAWRASEPPPALVKQAQAWMASQDVPAAQLMGASWLLATEQRADALAVLKKLTESEDRLVARLAEAQVWRTQFISATQVEIERWRKTVANMPHDLRAGPYFVLGQAEAHAKLPAAAITLMRVSVVYGAQRTLAVEALFAAAQTLADGKQPGEAYRVYSELAGRYPQSPLAPTARERCQALQNAGAEKPHEEAATNASEIAATGVLVDDADPVLFTGLMDRRLHSLAHRLCLANRASAANEMLKPDWVIRQADVEIALAIDAAPDQRDAHWKAAFLNAASLSTTHPVTNTTSHNMTLQLGKTHLALGEQLALEAAHAAGDEKRFERAQKELKMASSLLGNGVAPVKKRLASANESGSVDTANWYSSMQNRITCAQSRAMRGEAATLPAGGARIDKLAEAQKTLEPLLATELNDISSWEVRLEALACTRLLEKYDSARQLRAVLAEANPPPEMAIRLRAEQVRLELAAERLDVARELVREEMPAAYSLPTEAEAELDFARLEVLVARREEARGAGRTEEVETLSKEALETATHILWRYGAGWGRRANLLIAR